MKEQIQKILGMAKSGVVTDEQAAQLIEELGRAERAAAPPPRPNVEPARRGWGAELVRSVKEAISGPQTSSVQGLFLSDMKDNDLSMSTLEAAQGEQYRFSGNSIRMSSVRGLLLRRSVMADNEMSSSSFEELSLTDATLRDCKFGGSSFEDTVLDGAEVHDVSALGSHFRGLRVAGKSLLRDTALHGSNIIDLVLDQGAELASAKLNGVELNGLHLAAAQLLDFAWESSKLKSVAIADSRLSASMVHGARLSDFTISGSEFHDVMISGGHEWRRSGFERVTFSGCRLTKAVFSACRFRDVTFKDVTVEGIIADHLELTDRVIEGNEAFLRAIGKHAA